jgi:hypothetical protein
MRIRIKELGVRIKELGVRKKKHKVMILLFAIFLMMLSMSLGQTATRPALPETIADQAVQEWLKTKRPDMNTLMTKTPEEICLSLPSFLNSPPEATKVNFQDRKILETTDPSIQRFSYPAELPSGQLEIVEVSLKQNESSWDVEKVGFLRQLVQGRSWLQQSATGYVFMAFSLYVLFLLLRPSFLRRWLKEGWGVIKQHRRLVIGTLIALYALFGLGVLTGSGLPAECDQSILEIINTAVSSVGATDAYGSGNIARAAVVTFYQNFVSVTVIVLFGSGLLFGLPAYLISGLSFYVQGVPFGLLAEAGFGQLVFVLILLFLELTSYFLVVAGAGMLFITVVRKGFKGFNEGVRKLALMLPFAMLLLLLGAWYEAALIILPEQVNPQPAQSSVLEQHPSNFAALQTTEPVDPQP